MPDAYQTILDSLSKSKRVLVTTHVRPDGDALGSTAAMVMGMRAKKIDCHVLLLSHLPAKYAFVYNESGIPYTNVEQSWPEHLVLSSFDTLLVIDTGTWSQLPGMKDRLATFTGIKLVVDHHLTQEDWADQKLVVTQAAAAGEIIAELLDRWQVDFSPLIARALFLAIVSDTGWFQFSNTQPRTFRLAAKLMEAGANTDALYQLLYQSERPERVTLQAHAQQSLKLLCDNRVAVMQVSKQDFARTHGSSGDTEALINIPLQIRTVQVSILAVEPIDGGPIRVSLRSKGQVDVSKFAQQFGGGGHARAAGLKVAGTIESVSEQVIAAMMKTVSEQGE